YDFIFLFFFQAEDGIRDFHVTGVQTCALPISTYFLKIDRMKFKHKVIPGDTIVVRADLTEPIRRSIVVMYCQAFVGEKLVAEGEIGRASCRESVESCVGAGWVMKEAEAEGGVR